MIIGEDVFINTDVSLKEKLVEIGNHVAIDKGFYCTTQLSIGDYVHIGPYSMVIGGIHSKLEMQDFSFMSAGCKVVAGSDLFSESNLMGPLIPDDLKAINTSTVLFEKFSGLGVNCTILNGVTLAEGSIVCASSTVTKNTEPWTIYAGIPARAIGKRDKNKVLNQEQILRNRSTSDENK